MDNNNQYIILSEQFEKLNSTLSKWISTVDSFWWEKLIEPTTIVVLMVAIFAFFQWKTAEKSRKQELFDKRFDLYGRVFVQFQNRVEGLVISNDILLPLANEAGFIFDMKVAEHILSISAYKGKKLDYDWFNKPFEKYMRVK